MPSKKKTTAAAPKKLIIRAQVTKESCSRSFERTYTTVLLGKSQYGNHQPELLITVPGSRARAAMSNAFAFAAHVERLSADYGWIVQVDHTGRDGSARVYLELIHASDEEADAGLAVLHAANEAGHKAHAEQA